MKELIEKGKEKLIEFFERYDKKSFIFGHVSGIILILIILGIFN